MCLSSIKLKHPDNKIYIFHSFEHRNHRKANQCKNTEADVAK